MSPGILLQSHKSDSANFELLRHLISILTDIQRSFSFANLVGVKSHVTRPRASANAMAIKSMITRKATASGSNRFLSMWIRIEPTLRFGGSYYEATRCHSNCVPAMRKAQQNFRRAALARSNLVSENPE